jgi:peroxiredoxin
MHISVASSTPLVGSLAPDFTLPSTAGSSVALSGFRDQQHVLLAFFPLAFTSVCTAEVCAFGDDYSAFTDRGVAVLPISVDSVPTLKEFKAKSGTSVEMLSDFKREVSSSYGVLREADFFSNRAYVLIDKSGVVRWVHVEASPGHRRENSEILSEIDKLA